LELSQHILGIQLLSLLELVGPAAWIDQIAPLEADKLLLLTFQFHPDHKSGHPQRPDDFKEIYLMVEFPLSSFIVAEIARSFFAATEFPGPDFTAEVPVVVSENRPAFYGLI